MKRKICFLLVLCMVLGLAAGCGRQKEEETITSLAQLNEEGRKIGVAADTADDELVKEFFPRARIEYYNDVIPAYTAVGQGKLDAFLYGRIYLETALRNGLTGLKILEESVGEGNTAAIAVSPLTRIPDLKARIEAFLKEIREDGTLEEIHERWLTREDPSMPEIPVPETSPLHLVVGTTGSSQPFSFYEGTELTGHDIEIARRLAAWMGASLEFKVYDFNGIVAAALGGDVDCIISNLYVTPERLESIDFTEPTNVTEMAVVVKDALSPQPELKSFSELGGRTVSMITGAPFEELVRSKNQDVAGFSYYSSFPDMMLALKNRKTDAALGNNAIAALAVNKDPDLMLFPESLQEGVFGFAFAKGDPDLSKWQAAYEKIPEETKEAVWKKWTGADALVKQLPDQDWPGENGTVTVAACDTLEPMSYLGEGGELLGFDEEMLLLTARELDVHVEFTGMEFAALLSSVQSGRAKIGIGSIIVTPERQEAVDFLNYYPAAFVLIVRAVSGRSAETSFISEIRSSFEKTFIHEGRYRMFLQGILTTILITVFSVILGTLLGFAVYMACRGGNPAARALTRFCTWLVQGLPVVVLLMVLYYIVFSRAALSGAVVSVVGFTLVFASGMYGMLKSGVGVIDKGQIEAAYALGYSDTRAFFRAILPQAIPHIMPSYKAEITAIIKATAIVGYIAVQDLTRTGDLIRSRTYEAFFPLFAVAVIYLILEAVLTAVVSRIEIRTDPRRRSPKEILKGVKR
ncbi:MAG: transporter substrate-binding domain-containing protein [Lachnospiraceae bacterium]|nr:transporter substrate-binding domain-containing protein [Lachnospiraceae bacterium]